MVIKNLDQKYYSSIYSNNEAIRISEGNLEIVRSALSDISFSSNQKVLDVACGIGLLGKLFSNIVYGFDININAVKVARKNGIIAKIGDAQKKWDYQDEYFDMVIASHIIEHVISPDKLILEAKRVLKKKGLLIVITPNLAAWFNRIFLLFGFQPFFTEVSTIDKTMGLKLAQRFTSNKDPVGHLKVFTPGSLKDILQLHGFKNIRMRGVEFGSFPSFVRILDRFISRKATFASSLIFITRK